MKDARCIIAEYFENKGENSKVLFSLMRFLDTDTIVQWFVEEEYVDELEPMDKSYIQKYYHAHCY